MTYGDYIVQLQRDIYKLYVRAGSLRDVATGEEKDIFNNTRGVLSTLEGDFERFLASLPNRRFTMELDKDEGNG